MHYIAEKCGAVRADKSVEHLTTLGLLSQNFELNTRAIASAISNAFQTNREPDVRNFELKDQALSTATGISLYLALYPPTVDHADAPAA